MVRYDYQKHSYAAQRLLIFFSSKSRLLIPLLSYALLLESSQAPPFCMRKALMSRCFLLR